MSFRDGTAEDCPPEDLEPSKIDLPGTNLTLRQMFLVVGGAATVVTIINCCITFITHFIWRTSYRQQKHLARVAILPAVFAGFYWLGIAFYGRQTYLSPWVGIYEVYTLSCFFEYEVEILVPNGKTREEVMVAAPRLSRNKKKTKHLRGTYRWYRVARMFVYFGLLIHTIVTILQMIIARTLCHTSDEFNSVNALLDLLGVVATFMAIGALLRFYSRFSKEYRKHGLFLTFTIYKGIVLLYIVETLIITIVEAAGAVELTTYMSQADFDWGVHSFMVCGQSCLFSFAYVASLSGLKYRHKTPGPAYGPIRASGTRHGPDYTKGRLLLDVFFPKEPFTGTWEALRTFAGLFRGRKHFDYTGKTGITHYQRATAQTNHDSHELLPKQTRGSGEDTSYGKA